MVINQGDIDWVDWESRRRRSQDTGIRTSSCRTTSSIAASSRPWLLACSTSNLKRAQAPGNVSLESGEGNLPKQSVVNVSQIYTVDKSQLDEYIGTLSSARVREIINGIKLVVPTPRARIAERGRCLFRLRRSSCQPEPNLQPWWKCSECGYTYQAVPPPPGSVRAASRSVSSWT